MSDVFFQWLALALSIVGGIIFLWTGIRRILLRRQARQRPPIHEVGSPEYNAQMVGMIRTLNEQLASQGKRVPERVAMDLLQHIMERSEQ